MEPQRKQFTLRLTLVSAFCGLTLLGGVFMSTVTSMKVGEFIRDELRLRLADTVSIMASQIDGDKLHQVQTSADENSLAYTSLQKQLNAMRKSGTHIEYAYTMRKNTNGKVMFVVDSADNIKDLSHVGFVYDNPTPPLLAALASTQAGKAVFVEEDFTRDQWGTWISAFAPVFTSDGKLDGIIGVDVSAENVIEHERQYKMTVWLVSGFVVLLVLPLGLMFARRIRHPLAELAQEMEKVKRFELDSEVVVQSRIKEIHSMSMQLENMKRGLRSFRKYVPADLVRELIELGVDAKLGGERKELTMFFSDIAGFTAISERITPEELVGFLGEYLNVMNAGLLSNKATVDKYIGDGVMAFWGAPRTLPDHANYACRAALECQVQIGELNKKWKLAGHDIDFSTRIGINTGDVIVGNMGSDERMSYTVIGDNVNLTSRLEGVNKLYGTSILLSESTWHRVKADFVTRLIDKVVMVGKTVPINIYELVGVEGNVSAETRVLIERYMAAFALYSLRDFASAASGFGQILAAQPDQASFVMRERCENYIVNPPGMDWSGEFLLDSK